MNAQGWLNRVTDGDAVNAVAVNADISPATLFRQVKKDGISAENVIAICRAYGHPPVSGLVETGYLTATETGDPALGGTLQNATDKQLLEEIAGRLEGSHTNDPADGD
ncbi:hypothetical protein [Corynebacterium halotolerans]|uniref:DNA-binding protein n=1 Tax=Corynebacterium halotolerans YIM 70093 = DSM 44683 TaxID=1121362 RepID=M1NU99_9CORY|nr:hypothetical protein [Corynebacterium halotolerans]AGF73057.1 hypothetical protein A605_10285 [Corynebacterium halotolerans YIM 70093 = DSM 44683]